MKPILKKILLTVAFVLCTLVVPILLLLLFVDADSGFAVFVITFGVILFAILGYIFVSVHESNKIVRDAVEEMKMQNAAIAYKLTHFEDVVPAVAEQPAETEAEQEKPKKVNLNPADPLDFN